MTNEELLERAVTDICNDARLSSRGQHGDYYRCIISQAIARATARLSAQLEAVAGALSDSGIDFKTTDAAEAVRELTRERDWLAALVEWYGLLARAANNGVAAWDKGKIQIVINIGGVLMACKYESGLPVETEPLRSALLAAIGEPTP